MRKIMAVLTLALVALLASCTTLNFYFTTGDASSSTTSTGGAGGGGGVGGALACTPGAERPCYSGPAGTEGQGICEAGAEVCAADGMSWGACVGEVLPGVEDCATAVDEDCDGLAPPCKGNLLWAKRFGDIGEQQATGVATDASGNVLVTGSFAASINFGGEPLISAGGSPGSSDVFVAKLDSSGNHVWSKRFGDVNSDAAQGVAVDGAGNVLVVGHFGGTVDFGGGPLSSAGGQDVFLVKLDANGAHVWSKRFGDSAKQSAQSVVVDTTGNVIITGYFGGAVDFGGGPIASTTNKDVFLAKYDISGGHLWSASFGAAEGRAVAVDGMGNVLAAGALLGTVDFGGGQLSSAGGQDAFLAKLDDGGMHVWSKRFGDVSYQAARAVAVDSAANTLMTGYFSGSVDFGGGPLSSTAGENIFLAKFDAGGAHAWSKRFGDGGIQTGSGVALDAAGNVVLTGDFGAQLDFGGGPLQSGGASDVFLAKLDADGAHLWSKRFGDAANQAGRGVAVDPWGNVLIAGDFGGAIDFGAGSLVSSGGADSFVAKFGP